MPSISITDLHVSVVGGATATVTKSVSVLDVVEQIRSGDGLIPKVKEIRSLLAAGREDDAKVIKKTLPAAMWAGVFRRRSDDAMAEASGLLVGDLDHMDERGVQRAIALLGADPAVLAVFRSPSGSGVKFVVRTGVSSTSAEDHRLAFAAVCLWAKTQYKFTLDESGSNRERLCFLSWDPDIIVNPEAEVLEARWFEQARLPVVAKKESGAVAEARQQASDRPGDWYSREGDHRELLERFGWQQEGEKGENERWVRPGKEKGLSATWHTGMRVFHVFTDGAPPLKPNHGYSLFALRVALEFDGDAPAAARTCENERPVGDLFKDIPAETMGEVEQTLGVVVKDIKNKKHAAIIREVLKKLERLGLFVDATGALRRLGGGLSSIGLGSLAQHITFDMRHTAKDLAEGIVHETLSEICTRLAGVRRQALLKKFLNVKATKEGIVEVRRFIRAMTRDEREPDVLAMLHWLWLVKAKQSGALGDSHHMLCIIGRDQHTGKTTAARKLVEPWCELADIGMTATTLTDDRCTRVLSDRAIGFLDEMQGLDRADADTLKAIITAREVGYRPMRSNDRVMLPMMMSFIGTSNKDVAEIIRDGSGLRRFYELRVPGKADWATINDINYEVLWTAVDERDTAPGRTHHQVIAAEQALHGWRDSVTMWLEGDAFRALDGSLVDPRDGVRVADLYRMYVDYCEANGERPISGEYLGRRLRVLGWDRRRTGGRSDKYWAYFAPFEL